MAKKKDVLASLTPGRPAGTFNAEKCIRYLRWIGVEVSDEEAIEWLHSQKVHRLLKSMRKVVEECWSWSCQKGHRVYLVQKRGRGRKRKKLGPCSECGGQFVYGSAVWRRLRDGSIEDHRPKSERWKPLPADTREDG